MKKTRFIELILLAAVLLTVLPSCTAKARYISDSFFAMDTLIEVKLADGTVGAEAIFNRCREITSGLEKKLSAEDGTSEVAKFNMSGSGCAVSREVGEIFLAAYDVWKAGGGCFDPTTYPATLLWRESARTDMLPSDDEVSRAAKKCGMRFISYDPESSVLSKSEPWVMLDLGGVGKGYAEAKVIEYLSSTDAAYGVLSFGGNISVFGTHPSGSFTIALRDPGGEGYAGNISIGSGFISVSGGYERYYEIKGEKYCHIIDPRTGMPIRGKLLSTAVVSENGAAADALSTSLYVSETPDAAWKLYCEQKGTVLAFEAVLIYENEIYITPGLDGYFSLSCGRSLTVLGS